MTPAASLAALSADYSDDELDAIAELFDRPRLMRRRSPADHDEELRRAVRDAALRGLVARKALVLEGTSARPRVRLLEPHVSLLDPFVGPDATIVIRAQLGTRANVRALFLRDERAVEQTAVAGQAIKRMTAYARGLATDRVLESVRLGPDPASSDPGHEPIEVTARMWEAAEAAVANRTAPSPELPAPILDVLHARTSTTELELVHRDAEGVVTHRRIAWIEAGTIGTWSIESGPGEQPATLFLVPSDAESIRRSLTEAVTAAVDAADGS